MELGDGGIIIVALTGGDDDHDLIGMLERKPDADIIEVQLAEPPAVLQLEMLSNFAEENGLALRIRSAGDEP